MLCFLMHPDASTKSFFAPATAFHIRAPICQNFSKQAEENGFSQADRMLDMGFIDTVKALIGKMPKARSGKEMTSGNIRGMIIDEMRKLRMMIQ